MCKELQHQKQFDFLQTGEHLETSDAVVTTSGTKKEKLMETYEGLEVIGERVVVEVDSEGEFTGMISKREHSFFC